MNLLTITVKNAWNKKIRTILTLIGVAISIAAFVALVGLAENLKGSMEKTFETRGTDLIITEKGAVDIFASLIDQSYLESIKQIQGVQDASEILVDLYAMDLDQFVLFYGWDIDSYLFDELKIQGQTPRNDNEIILGAMTAERLKKRIGNLITLRGYKLTVVGIFESKSMFEEGAIIIPLSKLQQIKGVSNKVTMFNIKVNKNAHPVGKVMATHKQIEKVKKKIEDILPNITVKNVAGFISKGSPIFALINLTWAISAVAFTIAILGILNTMTTSVFERIREIGILLAIGWRNSRIFSLILIESMLFGLIGGILGIILGHGIMKILLSTPYLKGIARMNFDIIFTFKTILISVFLGFISGVYPALKAISIDPVKVLRYE